MAKKMAKIGGTILGSNIYLCKKIDISQLCLQQQGELIPDSINVTVTNSTNVKIGNEKNSSISGLPQSYRIPLKKSKSQNRLQSFPFYSDLHLHPEEGVEQCSRICDIGHCCLFNALPRHLEQRQLA